MSPLFLGIIFIIAEGALLMNAQASLDNAAREGVRAAVLCGTQQDCAGIAVAAAVQGHLGILSSDSTRLSIVVCSRKDTVSTSPQNLPCPSSGGSPTGCSRAASTRYDPVLGDGATGTTVEVDLYYRYDYYVGAVTGVGGPSTCMLSRARTAVT